MDDRRARFNALYRSNGDPWGFTVRPYEQMKYDVTLAALPSPRYARALEVGCSIGVLSEKLAARCDRFLGVDVSDEAIRMARRRCRLARNASFSVVEVPRQWPHAEYDLIVLSEILYFLTAVEVADLARLVARDLERNGDCVLVNWLGHTDTTLTGERAACLFTESLRAERSLWTYSSQSRPDFRLDVLTAC